MFILIELLFIMMLLSCQLDSGKERMQEKYFTIFLGKGCLAMHVH